MSYGNFMRSLNYLRDRENNFSSKFWKMFTKEPERNTPESLNLHQ